MKLTEPETRALIKGDDCDRIVLNRITVQPKTAESLVTLGLWCSFEEPMYAYSTKMARRYAITDAGRAALKAARDQQ